MHAQRNVQIKLKSKDVTLHVRSDFESIEVNI